MRYLVVYLISLLFLSTQAQNSFVSVRKNLNAGEYKTCKTFLDSCYSKDYHKDSVLFYSGLIAIKTGNKELCREYCNKLTKQYPNFGEVHYLKGLVHFQNENYGKSATEFTKALKDNPKDIKALFDRSIALGLLEDYTWAIDDLNTCISIDSSYTQAYYSRAYWYEFLGKYNEAAKDYQHTILLDSKNYDAYFGLAYIYQIQNEGAKACESINKAITAGSQIAEELKDRFCH
jgi:Tfp pilus assembly protein PilF